MASASWARSTHAEVQDGEAEATGLAVERKIGDT